MIQNLLESSLDENLSFARDKNTWTHSQYDRKAIELSIYADTILIDADVIFTNLKKCTIRARKLMVGQRKSKENLALTFQVNSKAKSDAWSSGTAPKPDLGENGNNGKNGANGFSATEVLIEVGCITGNLKSSYIRFYSIYDFKFTQIRSTIANKTNFWKWSKWTKWLKWGSWN